MLQMTLGMRFRIVGKKEPGHTGLKPVKDYDPNKIYPLVGCGYFQDALVLFFVNEQKKLWWTDHHHCECVDEQYYGSMEAANGNNESAAVSATAGKRKSKSDQADTTGTGAITLGRMD
jgi:hypothetical protein